MEVVPILLPVIGRLVTERNSVTVDVAECYPQPGSRFGEQIRDFRALDSEFKVVLARTPDLLDARYTDGKRGHQASRR